MSTAGWEIEPENPMRTLWATDPNFRATVEALENEAYWLLDEWTVYTQLYTTDKERIDLFNEMSPHFFGLLQFTLRDSIVAQICRITDPPKVSGKETLVIRRLCDLMRPTHSAIADELKNDADTIDKLCKPIRDWRNNKVSHLNLAAHLDADNNKLDDFSRQTVQDAVDAIKHFLNKARLASDGGEFCYDAVYRNDGVRPLLTALIQAFQYGTFETEDRAKFQSLLRTGKFGSLFTRIENTERE